MYSTTIVSVSRFSSTTPMFLVGKTTAKIEELRVLRALCPTAEIFIRKEGDQRPGRCWELTPSAKLHLVAR